MLDPMHFQYMHQQAHQFEGWLVSSPVRRPHKATTINLQHLPPDALAIIIANANAPPQTCRAFHSAFQVVLSSPELCAAWSRARHQARYQLNRQPRSYKFSWDKVLVEEASKTGVAAAVAAVLDMGADVNADGGRALCNAAARGHTAVVQLLLQRGADVNALHGAPLITAASGGHTATVRALLAAQADGNVANGLPLMMAATLGYAGTVVALLQGGADVNVQNGAALAAAALFGRTSTVQALLDNGANVHAREELALGLAAMFGRTDCVTMLLEHGADVHANQDLPLLLAAMCGHSNTVTVLERHGANWAHTPAPGMTRQWLKWMLRCGKGSFVERGWAMVWRWFGLQH